MAKITMMVEVPDARRAAVIPTEVPDRAALEVLCESTADQPGACLHLHAVYTDEVHGMQQVHVSPVIKTLRDCAPGDRIVIETDGGEWVQAKVVDP